MTRTVVKVEKAFSLADYYEFWRGDTIVIVGIFVLGLAGGMWLAIKTESDLKNLAIVTDSSLAAVGATPDWTTPPKDEPVVIPANNTGDSNASDDVAAGTDQSGEVSGAETVIPPSPVPFDEDVRIDTLNSQITDHETRIAALTTEIETVKNTSITLISEFNENCGNWADECAKHYSDQLANYNTEYDQKSRELSRLQDELSFLRKELADLTQ